MKSLILNIYFLSLSLSLASNETPLVAKEVETVFSGGYWTSQGSSGYYRFIITLEGWEHLANRVFIQKVAQDADEQASSIVETVAVSAFSQSSWRVQDYSFQKESEGWILSINVNSTYGDSKGVFIFDFRKNLDPIFISK